MCCASAITIDEVTVLVEFHNAIRPLIPAPVIPPPVAPAVSAYDAVSGVNVMLVAALAVVA